jgi:hypothetical protein
VFEVNLTLAVRLKVKFGSWRFGSWRFGLKSADCMIVSTEALHKEELHKDVRLGAEHVRKIRSGREPTIPVTCRAIVALRFGMTVQARSEL